jgi:hypothetical protein
MRSDKEHLDVDLGFLDEAKPREAQAPAASRYRVNWRNISVIGGVIITGLVLIGLSDKTSSGHPPPTSYAPSTTTVSNGQFSCSRYDSNQADVMAPKNGSELDQEEEELKRRRDTLNSLKTRIDMSGVTQHSSQSSIDRYNSMIDQYNVQLTSFKTDSASHQTRIETYNQKVGARNSYLLSHCRRAG